MPSSKEKDTGGGGNKGGRVSKNGNGHGHPRPSSLPIPDDTSVHIVAMEGEPCPHHHLHGELEQEDQHKNGRHRPRKRKLYGDICKQMEFYFSDANILKNRMMREVVEQANENSEGFVDLSIFLDFTKIQRLNASISHIQKALVTSDKLELSSDRQKARRKIPFDPSKTKTEGEVEECTIYVENIPRDSDHEWVEKIFQAFGPVAYVSLPKFKSGQHKSFGFVEFESNDSARKCVEAYGEEGGCLPNDIDPAKLRSIQSFQEEQEQAQSKIKKSPLGKSPSSAEPKDKVGSTKKRKAGETLEEDENEPKKKKDKKVASAPASSSSSESELEAQAVEGDESKSKKRKRKRNKGKKSEEAKLESESIVLKVLPKKSWRQLRNRYLNLQRSNMAKLKKQLQQQYLRAEHTKNFYQPPPASSEEHHHGNGSHHNAHRIFKTEKEDIPVEEPKAFDPILEIKMDEPPASADSFRNKITIELAEQTEDEAMISGFIKFVDFKENETQAFVRINGDESYSGRANNLLTKAQEAYKSARYLSAQEAVDYKKNVQAALKQKQKEQPRRNVRGKDRLMKAATKSTHIRFNEGGGGSDDDGSNTETEIKKEKMDTVESKTG
ncbi:unnamed protein product [Orchesella dallaii]|uniref:Uncharacterized protein n=1 Tax=Orchesella dallaii TaxID=48710 RepID=A0ABP1S6C7_9HEXA